MLSRKASDHDQQATRRMESPYASHASAVARILKTFIPQDYGLHPLFLLQNFTQMKGCGCKVPRPILLNLLKAFGNIPTMSHDEVGIGLDSCVVPTRHPGLKLVQTTDFFYPLVDDPYIMGRITAANVLSDLYAMGVSECDNMLMLLGVCNDFNDVERDVIVKEFIKGFKDAAAQAGTEVRGGQTVKCPWLLLGGVATSVCTDREILKVDRAKPGDVLILTKPLGGQVSVNSYEWLQTNNGRVKELHLDPKKILRAAQQAMEQMCRLNRNAAILARKYRAHACTDVTGFGILGHADNLARVQRNNVQFVIDSLPVIEYTEEIARAMNGNGFNLFGGTSAETSGGLLLALPEERAEDFRAELESVDGFPTFLIGRVVEAEPGKPNNAEINHRYTVVPVPSQIHSSAIVINQ
ncbi:seld-1 [Pristionchus pacificus]|uniref:Seld-1 n=1 Tax=Pristionchus pacificus TaxID=54126 RepID=A0A2A6CBS1_PRIPA|nr:seld-1 [Pristionchus pacificus]|eukprot:PDM75471.1 seld-1 [Pristionchus pacificus]